MRNSRSSAATARRLKGTESRGHTPTAKGRKKKDAGGKSDGEGEGEGEEEAEEKADADLAVPARVIPTVYLDEWQPLRNGNRAPPGRFGHGMCLCGEKVLVYAHALLFTPSVHTV